MQTPDQLIHLLYVPTVYCNLGCRYCYLGRQTDTNMLGKDYPRALSTLKDAVEKFIEAGYLPFNISLHGGEVTTLPGETLNDLFVFIREYYQTHQPTLNQHGFHKTQPHIKTNLYNFDKHYELMVEHQVSISASVDLPLSLHDQYRVTKRNTSTLARTLDNIRLLAKYPHRKKMSAVLYAEHLEKTDELIKDIWFLHREIGIDMNLFNFMFGFESADNQAKFDQSSFKAVSDEQQVIFYEKMKQAFRGTELEPGFREHWFDEFTPSYCTNSFNCGEKFFLLQSDGEIYSCVRGQGTEGFHYGNILTQSVTDIMEKGRQQIAQIHRQQGLHEDCKQCEYLAICHTGCPYVKHEQGNGKSYTCALQKAIYNDYPEKYPATPPNMKQQAVNDYVVNMHPQLITTDLQPEKGQLLLPNDLYDEKNALSELIAKDSLLQYLYSNRDIVLSYNGDELALASQILKPQRPILTLSAKDELFITVTDKMLSAACDDLVRNTLYLQFLKDKPVVYGDEQRTKQAHTYTFEIYRAQLMPCELNGQSAWRYPLTPLLTILKDSFEKGVLNNLFITTRYLRQYHYEKQRQNGFYHIQAINLPFQNIEFYWKEG